MEMGSSGFLPELEPEVERLFERHLSGAKEWFPHELVPWSRGRDFVAGDSGFDADGACADVRSALFVNLLTEDNLPYYTGALDRMYGDDGAWGAWARRWTAEEGRHSIVLRDYLTVTRLVDPIALERARMMQVERGQVPQPCDGYRGLIYVALQELATRVAHHNTGKLLDDPAGREVMKRVAADENRHHLFYRDLATAAFEIDASTMVLAVDHEVRHFEMPGTGIRDFSRHAKAIARAGIYNFEVHYKQVLVPVVLRHWNLESLTGLTPEAEQARESALRYIERVGKVAQRVADNRIASRDVPAGVH